MTEPDDLPEVGAAPAQPRRRTFLARRFGEDDFGIVLGLLVTVYVLYALSSALWTEILVLVLYLFTLGLAVRTSRPMPHQKRFVRVVLVVSAVVVVAAFAFLPPTAAEGVLDGVCLRDPHDRPRRGPRPDPATHHGRDGAVGWPAP